MAREDKSVSSAPLRYEITEHRTWLYSFLMYKQNVVILKISCNKTALPSPTSGFLLYFQQYYLTLILNLYELSAYQVTMVHFYHIFMRAYILCCGQDGSVRVFSPITGLTLTIVYPRPSFQVYSDPVFSRVGYFRGKS